jgi:hypothetical protein
MRVQMQVGQLEFQLILKAAEVNYYMTNCWQEGKEGKQEEAGAGSVCSSSSKVRTASGVALSTVTVAVSCTALPTCEGARGFWGQYI